jgi:hypothetical protein
MDGVVKSDSFHFQVLGLGLPTVDDGRDAASGAQLLVSSATGLRPRKGIQCD